MNRGYVETSIPMYTSSIYNTGEKPHMSGSIEIAITAIPDQPDLGIIAVMCTFDLMYVWTTCLMQCIYMTRKVESILTSMLFPAWCLNNFTSIAMIESPRTNEMKLVFEQLIRS